MKTKLLPQTMHRLLLAAQLAAAVMAQATPSTPANVKIDTDRYFYPAVVATDRAGNIYMADMHNQTISRVTLGGKVTLLAGLDGRSGSQDGTGATARFNGPLGLAVDCAGNIYVADTSNDTIRRVTPAGVVTTLAGLADSPGSADGPGAAARFNNPRGGAVDGSGNFYVADRRNHTIRVVTPAGLVRTLAGQAGCAGSADGMGAAARFDNPCGVAADSAGNIYVADRDNHTIRVVTPAGVVRTLAGLAQCLGSDDGTGSAARFQFPTGVAVDSAGHVFVAEPYNSTIREVTPSGAVTTLAGLAGRPGWKDGTGNAARLNCPASMAMDCSGNIYVADAFNFAIRRVTPDGAVTTLAGDLARK